ncbi:FAD-dependent oxidoreductase [Horticoccus sp. 23ND18S-11]|uniref:FAD-dependent oxidoreductase n=1 Tax=Horticoccus sp. 23ND18S-11 TaxID=3391832 RepID=UPI0039C97400
MFLLSLLVARGATASYDVVVYGGTSGGITAAIQAARMGKTAVLIEPTQFLGGLTTGGLGATDIGNKRAIGGMSREFYGRIWQYYQSPSAWKHQTRDQYVNRRGGANDPTEKTMWTFEPHVATRIYDEMLAEVKSRVTVIKGERLDLKKGVVKDGARILRIVMESGRVFEGRMFIDASYEGDLLAKAGVSYHVGREANAVYGETINGVQAAHTVSHQFTHKVDPYVKPGDPKSGVLPGINVNGPGEEFSGDRKVQAYNFRMCTTDVPENRRAWEKPARYNPDWFELLLRNFEAGDHRVPWNPVWMPNRKTDTNNNYAISTDFIGMNWDYPEADYATRARIWREHEDWQKGLMWTLANNPRVPEKVRAEFQRIGLAKDEFKDNDNWPRQLYVREARRMIGEYVMTEKNCTRTEVVTDSVGMGAYNMDSHNIQRYITKEGFVRNEGDVQVRVRPYPISYRSIRPKAAECVNLLAPVCLSASHIAYGSIRMEPVFMVLGQSAATAAVQAIEQGVGLHQIDLAQFKARLEKDGQVLDFESAPIVPRIVLPKTKLDGVVVDDLDAIRTGFDRSSSAHSTYVQSGYHHDNNDSKGNQTARFVPDLKQAGRYQVFVAYPWNANRASNAPVTIKHADGVTKVTLNQKKKPAVQELLEPVGTFRFEAGQGGYVEIGNAGTDGFVVIDAVQWVPAKP